MSNAARFSGDRLAGLGALFLAVGGLSLVAVSTTVFVQSRDSAPRASAIPAERAETPAERCALPAGVPWTSLSSDVTDRLVTRSALCLDLEAGRIDRASYLRSLDELTREPLPPLPERLWAESVVETSSEYGSGSESWSARKALGPADVYPSGGDDGNAWASLEEDAKVEVLELAVPKGRVAGVEVYETYNPGAVSRIELVSASGQRRSVYDGVAHPLDVAARVQRVDMRCTDDPIVAVRLTVDSAAVPGWNEIDAVAVRPCR